MKFINNYIDQATNANFYKKENGDIVYFPFGVFGKGRLIQDNEQYTQIFVFVRKMIVFGFIFGLLCALLINLVKSSLASVSLLLVLLTLRNIFAVKRMIRNLPIVDDKFKFGRGMTNATKALGPRFIKAVLALCVVAIGIGAVSLLTGYQAHSRSAVYDVLLVVLGAVCLMIYTVIYRLRQKAEQPEQQKTQVALPENVAIIDSTPATKFIAILFVSAVCYFIVDQFYWAKEFYAENPPYWQMVFSAAFSALLVYLALSRVEPNRKNTWQYALLFGFGLGLASYSFMLRLNQWSDEKGLNSYTYFLTSPNSWRAENTQLPGLVFSAEDSDWWKHFSIGDSYEFELRKGGLGFWQVNMSKIYIDQARYYNCKKRPSCPL